MGSGQGVKGEGRYQKEILFFLRDGREWKMQSIAMEIAELEVRFKGNRSKAANDYLEKRVKHDKEVFRIDMQKAIRMLVRWGYVTKVSRGYYQITTAGLIFSKKIGRYWKGEEE